MDKKGEEEEGKDEDNGKEEEKKKGGRGVNLGGNSVDFLSPSLLRQIVANKMALLNKFMRQKLTSRFEETYSKIRT